MTDLKAFYIHLFAYLSVVIGLLLVNVLTGGDWWVQWVFFGWGIGIIAHALAVFARTPRVIAAWERENSGS